MFYEISLFRTIGPNPVVNEDARRIVVLRCCFSVPASCLIRWMRKIFFFRLVLLAILPLAAIVADPPVTRIDYRFISKDLVPGSFEASTRKMWRAGDSFLRLEEEPDPAQHIHGVIISNAPHSWLWNRYENTARHVVDPGPTFDVIVSVFPWVTSPELRKLQMGREVAFFEEHKAKRISDAVLDGVAVTVHLLNLDGYKVTLFARKDNGKPFQFVLDDPKEPYIMRYETFEEGLPFDRKLFELPANVRVIEAK